MPATAAAGPSTETEKLTQLDEETDPLSTLSSSLSLLLQIASQSLYRLSSSSHIQLHPSIPPHVHSHSSAEGLIPPEVMVEDIKELVEDFMDRVKSMKREIEALEVERTEVEHTATLQALEAELDEANKEYLEVLSDAEELQRQVEVLLLQSCP